MKKLIYAGIAALLLSGCGTGIFDSKNDAIEELVQRDLITSYFPMNVWDTWVYKGKRMGKDAMYTVIVTGIKKADGKSYFEFERRHDDLLTSRLFRADKDNIFELVDGIERVYLKMDGKGDTRSLDDYILVKDDAVVETGAGTFKNCLVFQYGKDVMDAGGSLVLAPGIGIVKFESIYIGGIFESMELDSAVIKGVKVPR